MRLYRRHFWVVIASLLAGIALIAGLQSSAEVGTLTVSPGPPGMTEANKVRLLEENWRTDARAKTKHVDVSLLNVTEGDLWTPIKVVIDGVSDPDVIVTGHDGLTPGGQPYYEYLAPAILGSGETSPAREWEFTYTQAPPKLGHDLSFTARVFACTDADYDGFFAESGCGTPVDCDDADAAINPGATEVCDGIDNDCDGEVDEGVKTTFYADVDGDGRGDPNAAREACAPAYHEVSNADDCDDSQPSLWMGDGQGGCAFAGFTDCTDPYAFGCNPAVSNVASKLYALREDKPTEMLEDKFKWTGFEAPGAPLSGSEKRHLQSIQAFSRPGPEGKPDESFLVVTMSDETDDDAANISIVKLNHIGSESDPDDQVVYQRILNWDHDTKFFNHAGGAQLIGEYLFVALEDFEGDTSDDPLVGIWKINRKAPPAPPDIKYHGSYQVFDGDPHHSTVAVTKMMDGSYLSASCIVSGCDIIRFFKSDPQKPDLADHPEFVTLDTWGHSELIVPDLDEDGDTEDEDAWSDCPPQNMNMVVDTNGTIYVVLFGVERTGAKAKLPCGSGEHDDHIYLYKVGLTDAYEITLEFVTKVDIGTGHNCDCVAPFFDWPPVANCNSCVICKIPLGATGENFEAGSGLWIRPEGSNDIAVLATEHYDSCGDPGKSRWGVTENWDGPDD